MITLGGGSVKWLNIKAEKPGFQVKGAFASFEPDVPSQNPAFPPQSVLTLSGEDGTAIKIGCPTALASVFKSNKVPVGTGLVITYQGKRPSKKRVGMSYHAFEVQAEEATDFPPVASGTNAAAQANIDAARKALED